MAPLRLRQAAVKKIVKLGGNIGILFPRELVRQLNLQPGERFNIYIDQKERVIFLEPLETKEL